MENHKNQEMLQKITNKLGFDIQEYNIDNSKEAHERDDIPNPFDKLSLDELLFLRANNYFLSKKAKKRREILLPRLFYYKLLIAFTK